MHSLKRIIQPESSSPGTLYPYIRRGHYELDVADTVTVQVMAAVDELGLTI